MSERDDNLEFANEQLLLQEAKHKVSKSNVKLKPIGICHNCEEDLDHAEKIFCDRVCAEDWEKYALKR